MYKPIQQIAFRAVIGCLLTYVSFQGPNAGAQVEDGQEPYVDQRTTGTSAQRADGAAEVESAGSGEEGSLSNRAREALGALQKGQTPPAQALAVLLEEAVQLPRAARLVLEATPAPAREGAIFAVIAAAPSKGDAGDVTRVVLTTLGTNSETVEVAQAALTSSGYGDVDVPALVETVSAASEQVVGVGVAAAEDAERSEVDVADGNEGGDAAPSGETSGATDTADGALPAVGDALGGAGDVSPSE